MLNDPEQKGRRRLLRGQMTPAEKKLWSRLRSRRLAQYKFRRQTSIGSYTVDFYCAEKGLVLEIDGDVHGFAKQQRHDQSRQRALESQGFRVLRFTNQDVKESIDGVVRTILLMLGELG